ncbi:3-keto-5-aminohexanoate cleavage protein [Mycobacterium sp.]|uniref:3-keto-5-aminohexanoate cleavage protein n=1 Tax=Mycobacterium sp. TaxID=1785 RepID=UPI002CCC7505|nr:3-keto-5-aminohexanoate cleavage protein [Mycobacterium sp.]HME49804.1 3-keto-5-aminohexanoate cleavage protein [Mycobacterium sp.]
MTHREQGWNRDRREHLCQACLNGARTPDQHPALPVTPDQPAADAVAAHRAGAKAVQQAGSPAGVLLHGHDGGCWPLLRHAGSRGLQTRIGMEDTLLMPDGSAAPGNAALVTAALELLARG